MAEPLLELQALDVHYGAIHALRGISIRVGQGEIVSLIGANGAGKTTTLRAVSGMLRPSAGQIRYQGAFIGGLKPHRLVTAASSPVEASSPLRRQDCAWRRRIKPAMREQQSRVSAWINCGAN